MLHLYHSNRTEVLLARLAAELSTPLDQPLCSEVLLVQNPGMAHWLNIQLAQLFGIAANIEFPLPSSFLWRLLRQFKPELPELSPLDKGPLTWTLYQRLPQDFANPQFLNLKTYVDQAGVASAHRARYQLANQLADVFDQYAIYRPDWLSEWEQGRTSGLAEEHRWQAGLWQSVHEQLHQRSPNILHRARIWEETFQQRSAELMQSKLPKRLCLFGLSSMPPSMMAVFERLAEYTEIHWFVLNPCRLYWGDLRDEKQLAQERLQASNATATDGPLLSEDQDPMFASLLNCPQPLLASMGKQGRDYLDRLFEMAHGEEALFRDILPSGSQSQTASSDLMRSSDQKPPRLLSLIQQQILDLEDGRLQPQAISSDDDSLTLHRCYSAHREIEVLYDQLLRWFDQDPELKPRDIIVMIPDVVAYAPFIETVFANAPKNRYIPWSISDRPQDAEHPLIHCFLDLLLLSEQRLTLTELFGWLALDAVQVRFQLTTQEVTLLREWVEASHLCWGLNTDHKAQFNVPGQEQFSWRYALKRLLMGYASVEPNWELGIVPLGQVEGIEAAAVGALADWITALEAHLEYLKQPHPASEWVAYWFEQLETLFAETETSSDALGLIRDALQNWMKSLNVSGEDPLVDQWVLYDVLSDRLMNERSAQRFFVGYVNFCTLMPMRSIPFKIVCLLGMNDTDYPRTVEPLHFDLLSHYYRKGDRSRREDDRFLFLEALMSARKHLLISYRHRHIRDNSALAASVLLLELLDYCDQAFYITPEANADMAVAEQSTPELSVRHQLTVDHPLQPFHPQYFTEGVHQSYQAQWLLQQPSSAQPPSVSLQAWQRSSQDMAAKHQWSLERFVRAFKHLPRFFMQERFGVQWYAPEKAPDAVEPYTLDGLRAWQLRQKLLDARLKGIEEQEVLRNWRHSGWVPEGVTGDVHIERIQADIERLWQAAEPYLAPNAAARRERIEVDVSTLAGHSINGWLTPGSQTQRIELYPGKDHRRALFQWGLKHMLVCASKATEPLGSWWFGLEQQWYLAPVAKQQAQAFIETAVEVLERSLVLPQPFLDSLSFDFIDPSAKEADQRYQKALARWQQAYDDPDEYYLRRLFAEESYWLQQAQICAETLYGPLLPLWEPVEL
jgi:exodeoxyribonuclease V gamma subunit